VEREPVHADRRGGDTGLFRPDGTAKPELDALVTASTLLSTMHKRSA